VTWDDWGGWYDHVRPPGHQSYGGLGFRLPMLVISPFARKGYVTHNQYEFGTIVKFVEDNWGLPRLGNTDVRAASMIDDVFDFKQSPRPFQTIQAQYSKEFFLHQKPGTRTIETDD
ncbi:MAG TPA: alkaline phosphatase family protein, partial [Candidatus Acidoferrum sp.]|nr:alkaline phosphatase family protein [Candidatus Acidoferrum sp.]